MKQLLRILGSAKELKKFYVIIGVFTVLISLMGALMPLLTGLAIDELRKGSNASVRYVIILAAAIFAQDLLTTLFSNISGYYGDQMTYRLNNILSRRYYAHLMTLPQSYFDRELTGKIISR